MIIRSASAGDAAAIAGVHRAAFPGENEARLVAALHADGDVLASLVADDAGAVAGHVLFSRMTAYAAGLPISAASLGPVAVMPQRQHQGIGGQLIDAGLEALADLGIELVFVLGDPRYYRRFGFDTETAAPFESPYAGPHLMARWLGTPQAVDSGHAAYAPAFGRMGSE